MSWHHLLSSAPSLRPLTVSPPTHNPFPQSTESPPNALLSPVYISITVSSSPGDIL